MAGVSYEIRSARRILRRRPGSALLAIITIAISVTATSVLFSVAYSVLFRPLPWPNADRLVQVWETRDGTTNTMGRLLASTTFDAWRDAATTVDGLAAYRERSITLAGPDGAERVRIADVTPNLLGLLGAVPTEGRILASGDTTAAVVSAPLARRLFGGTGPWAGRTLDVSGQAYTVVGVLPASFGFPAAKTDGWLSFTWPSNAKEGYGLVFVGAVARLPAGVSPAQAAAEGEARARAAAPLSPGVQKMVFGTEGQPRIHSATLLDVQTERVRRALVATIVGMALLLVTAIVSLAGLQLARVADRRRELAMRAAIGASRGRLVTLLAAESLWLAVAGGAIALVSTWWLLALVPHWLPADFPRIGALAFDGVSFLIVAATTAATAGLAGMLPAWHAARLHVADLVADDARAPAGFGARAAAGRSRRVLLAAQMSVAVVLIVAAGLVVRTLAELVREDLGYTPANLVMARLIGTSTRIVRGSGIVSGDTLERLIARLGQLPGVTGVAVSTALPFQARSGRMSYGFTVPARDGSGREVPATVTENNVTPEYFDLVGMRVVTGRALNDGDYHRSPRTIVVNEAFARAYLGDRPLGPFANRGEIVGVVADVRDRGATAPVDPQIFELYDPSEGALLLRPSAIFLRTSGAPDAIIPLARDVVRSVDNRLGLDDVATMDARLSAMVAEPRLFAVVAAASAGFALLVAGVGLFSVLWHGVSGRTREIGVRTALGATPRTIAGQVMAEGLGVAALGGIMGLAAAALLARYVRSLLYHVAPHDPLVFAAAPAVLFAIAAIACYLPARRAARIDPVEALRAR
jgi:predicted permease